MNIREQHYDFKQKLNKVDSQKDRNLIIPEIDWKLNEATEVFVKMIAQPRLRSQLGFETTQRTIDDIRTIVVDQKPQDYIVATAYDTTSFIVSPPVDYWYLAKIKILATKGDCTDVLLYDSKEVQHDDQSESSPFDKSSFEWRTSNYRFNKEGLRVFTDGSYTITKVGFEYIKRPVLVHNAQDYVNGTYNMLDGTVLTGFQNSDLPEGVHREIVDIAVMITAGDLNLPSYGLKQNKVKTVTE